MMAAVSSGTLLKTPRRMQSWVISAKKRSTMLSQDAEVGVKCKWKRGFAFSQPRRSESELVAGADCLVSLGEVLS